MHANTDSHNRIMSNVIPIFLCKPEIKPNLYAFISIVFFSNIRINLRISGVCKYRIIYIITDTDRSITKQPNNNNSKKKKDGRKKTKNTLLSRASSHRHIVQNFFSIPISISVRRANFSEVNQTNKYRVMPAAREIDVLFNSRLLYLF